MISEWKNFSFVLRWHPLNTLLWCVIDDEPTLTLSAAYMRQWIGSVLVQIMACRLFRAQSLSKPLLDYSLGNKLKIQNVSFVKMHLKIASAKWQPFCPGGRCVHIIWINSNLVQVSEMARYPYRYDITYTTSQHNCDFVFFHAVLVPECCRPSSRPSGVCGRGCPRHLVPCLGRSVVHDRCHLTYWRRALLHDLETSRQNVRRITWPMMTSCHGNVSRFPHHRPFVRGHMWSPDEPMNKQPSCQCLRRHDTHVTPL